MQVISDLFRGKEGATGTNPLHMADRTVYGATAHLDGSILLFCIDTWQPEQPEQPQQQQQEPAKHHHQQLQADTPLKAAIKSMEPPAAVAVHADTCCDSYMPTTPTRLSARGPSPLLLSSSTSSGSGNDGSGSGSDDGSQESSAPDSSSSSSSSGSPRPCSPSSSLATIHEMHSFISRSCSINSTWRSESEGGAGDGTTKKRADKPVEMNTGSGKLHFMVRTGFGKVAKALELKLTRKGTKALTNVTESAIEAAEVPSVADDNAGVSSKKRGGGMCERFRAGWKKVRKQEPRS